MHSLPNVMSSYARIEKVNNKVVFVPMPDKNEIYEVLLECVYCLLKIACNLDKHFNLGRENELLEIRKSFYKTIDDRLEVLRKDEENFSQIGKQDLRGAEHLPKGIY